MNVEAAIMSEFQHESETETDADARETPRTIIPLPVPPSPRVDQYAMVIEAIKKHPALYDPQCMDYQNVPYKEDLWVAIASQLDMNVEVLKKRWRCLRDQFIKKKKKLRDLTGKDATRVGNWRYMESLEFIVPFINIRGPNRKGQQKTVLKIEEACSDEEQELEEEEGWMTSSSPSNLSNVFVPLPKASMASFMAASTSPVKVEQMHPGGARSFKRLRVLNNDAENDDMEEDIHNSNGDCHFQTDHAPIIKDVPSSSTVLSPTDEDECFLLSCLPTFRKLTPYRRMELKCKIQQLLLEFTPKDSY